MRSFVIAALVGALLPMASPAIAGVFTDDMSKCLVGKTSDADKTAFTQWIFGAMALHPSVQSMANITPAQQDALSQKAAQLMMRLLTVDCRAETVAALKYEGTRSLEAAFGVLGQAAMAGLMNDPAVNKGMEALGKYADSAKLQALFKEAGVPMDKSAASAPANK